MPNSSAFFLGLHLLNFWAFIWESLDLDCPFSLTHDSENWTPNYTENAQVPIRAQEFLPCLTWNTLTAVCVPGWHFPSLLLWADNTKHPNICWISEDCGSISAQSALPGRSFFMRATGWACLLGTFAFDISLLSVFYWHLFDFWPYLRGFQNQFGFKPCLPVGNGIDDLCSRWSFILVWVLKE